ncbi:MAG TPA: serine hydrolase domain-containing protein [Chitinophagaceae bacterium]|jgi:D-alanyl-D-alanine carboxypeptidase|nr:serine hydrolase domain-containing protein [Chitinophagaceae bacterium]
MKLHLLSALLILSLAGTGCQKNLLTRNYEKGDAPEIEEGLHPMKDSLQAIVQKYIARGLPGIQVAVKSPQGWAFAQGGYAQVESRTPFHPHTPTWLFSITKTYTAALVMQQKEQGRLELDAPIHRYLPAEAQKAVPATDRITLRMLLNHSSGLVNFTELPAYQLAQFNHPMQQPSMKEILRMIKGKPLQSEPGLEYSYCNTNYLLLTLILESVTGKSYKQLVHDDIIKPLDLRYTYFDIPDGRATQLGFPNYYFDRHANEQLENITAWNHALGRACMGWGGIAGTPADAILFYEALMKGRVVSSASLAEMLTWFRGNSSEGPDYGLGIEYYQYAEGTTPQRGHEGDGIGNSTLVLHVPDTDTYLFVNVTAGRQIFGPYLFTITDFKNEISAYVARWR